MSRADIAVPTGRVASTARVFESLESLPGCLAPLLGVIAALGAMYAWYYSQLDVAWYVDELLRRQGLTDAKALDAAQAGITRGKLLAGALAGLALFMPLARLLEAAYLWLVARGLRAPHALRSWYAFACWSSLPELLALPAMALNIHRAAGGRLAPEHLDPTSLAILLDMEASGPWGTIGSLVTVALVIKIAIFALGLRAWLAASWPASIALAATPYAALLGVVAAIAGMRQ